MRWYVTAWAWFALFRRMWRVVTGLEVRVVGECKGCGRCCREIVLHSSGRWIRTERHFEREKQKDSALERFRPLDTDDDGRIIFGCSLLRDDGLCGDYENRLPLCRNHPNPGLYYSGVTLAPYCGYRFKQPGLRALLGRLPGPWRSRRFADELRRQAGNTDQDDEES